jgi:DNA-binding NarL/FixJ family response regulator
MERVLRRTGEGRRATNRVRKTAELVPVADFQKSEHPSRRALPTLLYVDDHPLFREGFRRALSAEWPELRILTAPTLASALDTLERESEVDLCLTDQRLGDGEGVGLVEIARERYPLLAVGILTGEVTSALSRRARAAGAIACLSKEREIGSLALAVRGLFEGEPAFDDTPVAAEIITDRRRDILRMAAEGLLDKQIGAELEITESTVRNHWQHIFERLAASNRTEAVSKAIRLGII